MNCRTRSGFRWTSKHASYDPDAVRRFLQILVNADRVFKQFRTGFLGKASPVHFFWGSFDLAVTRFSGRRAPRHPGGVPIYPMRWLAKPIPTRSAAPASGRAAARSTIPRSIPMPIPNRTGYRATQVRPAAAFFSEALGEFILPYDAVRTAAQPDQALLEFLQSTYDAAANAAKWDRDALECAPGQPGVVRQV